MNNKTPHLLRNLIALLVIDNIQKRILFTVSFIAVVFVSCKKSVTDSQLPQNTNIHPASLSINSANLVLLPGQSRQLSVTFTPFNTTDKRLTWSISNSAVATIDANGLVHAIAEGTATITAESMDLPVLKVTSILTVLKNYEVHIVGNGPAQGYSNAALYWKNGVASPLTGGNILGTNAYAITSSGADIYIAGTSVDNGNWEIATYWKNGMPVQLSMQLAQINTSARSIAVSGSSVYVAGYSFTNTECPNYCFGRFRASYWSDNGGTINYYPLYNTISSTIANSVAVSGPDVIIAGSRANSNFGRWSTYWKNDFSNETALSGGTNYFEASAVAINNTDIYIAGHGGCPDMGCISRAKVWRNNMSDAVNLTDGSAEAQTNAITISNGIIYVCGYEKNSLGRYVARYWTIQGNEVKSYALTDGVNNGIAKGITVRGDDIFIVGLETDSTGKKTAKYWRAYKDILWTTDLLPSQYSSSLDTEANGILVR